MVRVWDFLMRRKPLMFGFLLIFIVSAAFSSVYLHPNITRGPVNIPDATPTTEVIAPTPEPETEPTSESVIEPASDPASDPTPEQTIDQTVHLAIVAPSPEEVAALAEAVAVPRTNFGFTLPGNIINLASLNQIVANHQLEQVDAVKTWHYIISATTAALIFGGVMVGLARFLSKNMLE